MFAECKPCTANIVCKNCLLFQVEIKKNCPGPPNRPRQQIELHSSTSCTRLVDNTP